MKFKHILTTLTLSLAVGAGVFAGVKANNEVKEAKADVWPNKPTIYFVPSDNWAGDSATFKMNYFNTGNSSQNGSVVGVLTDDYNGRTMYKFEVTDSNAYPNQIQFLRMSADGNNQWNYSNQFDIDENYSSGYDTVVMDAGHAWYDTWVVGTTDANEKTISWQIRPEATIPEFSLIGTFGGSNWDDDEDFTVDSTTTTATLTNFTLAKGEAFKVRKNHAWTTTYGWSNANGHINISDALERDEECLGSANSDNNIAVLHDGTYSFSLNYSTGVLSITGTRATNDSDVVFEIYISSDGGTTYNASEMELKSGSTTEYMITRDFVAGEKFYFKFGSYYYHYSDIKATCTLLGTQFVANGQDCEALYNANYTIYYETDDSEDNYGGWLQYNSVNETQVRLNVISYAKYFNEQIEGVCDEQGVSTVISDLQTAWANVKTRFDNAPADSIRTAIKAATAADENDDVAEFVAKYASVYYLRGSSLSSQGGDFLLTGITPKARISFGTISKENNTMLLIVIASSISLIAVGGFFFLKRKQAL